MRPTLFVAGLLGLTALAAHATGDAQASTRYTATINGQNMDPPVTTTCQGTGTFVVNDDESLVNYDIHFDPWVPDEFQSHIHVKFPPEVGGEAIWTDLPAGPDKVGGVALEPSDALAFREGRMFVLVHTLTHLNGEVKGFIVPEVAARPATWGALKAIYR